MNKLDERSKARKCFLHSLYVGGATFFSSFAAQCVESGLTANVLYVSVIAFIIATGGAFFTVMKFYDTTEYELAKDFKKKTGKKKPKETLNCSEPNNKVACILHPWWGKGGC